MNTSFAVRGCLYGHQKEVINTQAAIVRWKTGATCKCRNRKSENIGVFLFLFFSAACVDLKNAHSMGCHCSKLLLISGN